MNKLSDLMQKEVKAWRSSGLTKKQFLKDKAYSKSKFEYWLNKEKFAVKSNKFQEVQFSESTAHKVSKVLEIESPSGIKISVFA